MKKFRLFFFLTILSSVFILSTCKKSDSKHDIDGNCDALLEDLEDASDAFLANMTEETCIDYYDAIEDYYDGCDEIPSAYKDMYDEWLEDIDCSVYDAD
jgi:hypothetical protein